MWCWKPTFLFLGLLAFAVTDGASQDQAMTFISTYDGTAQPFRLFVPKQKSKREPFPLVVVLHGKGVNQNAWFDYTPIKEFAERHGYVVAAPHGRGDYFYRGAAEQDILDIIQTVKSKLSIDPDRVYLMGHSMGGWGTWWVGLRNPDIFAAISPMSGFAQMELLPNALHLDPFIIHDADDAVVSVEQSRMPAKRLSELGVSFRYKEEHGYGHMSKMIGDNFPHLFEWMEKHRRTPRPEAVHFVTRTPSRWNAYWLRILETTQYPHYAVVDARVKQPGTISIVTENVHRFAIHLAEVPIKSSASLKVSLNKGEFSVGKRDGWAIFTWDEKGKKWNYSYDASQTLPPWESPVLTHLAKDSREVTSPTCLASWAAGLICEETGSELCLFLNDMFQFPGGPLTEDAVLDLYVYPEERLAQFRYGGESLPKYLNEKSQIFPIGRYDPHRKKTWKVIAPLNLAIQLDRNAQTLPEPIGTYLLRTLRRKSKM